MAQLVVTAAGATIGYLITGTPQGAYYGAVIANTAYGIYETSRKRIDGPRLTDFRMPGTDYGEPITWLIGSQRMPGQIWWASEKREIRTTTSSGKGSGPKVNSFTYEIDVLIGLNEEDGDGTRLLDVARIWANGRLVRNRLAGASDATLSAVYREDLWRRLTVYTGHPSQLPDPTYEAAVGAGNAPAYRGRGTVMIEGLQLDGSGQLPILTFEAVTAGTYDIAEPALSDLEVPRAAYYNAGTIGASEESGDEYWISIGGAGGGGTTVDCYRVSLQQIFDGSIAYTPLTLEQSFTVDSNAATVGAGAADVPLYVQNQASTTGVAVYSVPAGTKTVYNFAEDWSGDGGVGFRFVQRGTSIIFGNNAIGSKKLHKFTVQVGGTASTVTSSAALADYVSSVEIANGVVYAAGANVKVVYVLDLATMVLQRTVNRPSYSTGHPDLWSALFVVGGYVHLIGHDAAGDWKVWRLETDDSWTQLSNTIPVTLMQSADRCQSLAPVGAALVCGSNYLDATFYKVWTAGMFIIPETFTVRETVEAVCYRGFRDSTRIDASELDAISTPVRGATMTSVEGVRGLLSQLQIAHGFECITADKLYFRPRGAATVYTIPHADLGAKEDEALRPPLPLVIGADIEVPPRVAVQFFNAANDYQIGTERSDRLVLTSQISEQSVQLGLPLLPSEAKAIADRMMAEAAAALTTTKLSLGLQYAKLEPGDAVEPTTDDGETLRFRLGRKSDAGGVLTFEAVRDDASLQDTAGETDENYTSGTEVAAASFTLWQTLDIPLLRDADDGPGWVIAARGVTSTWPGAQVLLSPDGTTFENVVTVAESAVLGSCTSTLGDWTGGPDFIDEFSSVVVSVAHGTLSSSTREAVLNDRTINAARVGAELVRFITATQLTSSPNTYRLSRLLRGQLGTEWACEQHEADEQFTLLRVLGGLRNVLTEASSIGQAVYVKAVTSGMALSSVTAAQFTDTGVKLKPYAPAHLRAVQEVSGALTLTWERRTRLAYRWPSESYLPLGEETESYEIDLEHTEYASEFWDPAAKEASITLSLSDTKASIPSGDLGQVKGVRGYDAATADRFFALQLTSPDGALILGLANASQSVSSYVGGSANSWGYSGSDGKKYTGGGAGVAYGSTFAGGDIVGVWLYQGTLSFYLWTGSAWAAQGTAYSGLTGTLYPAFSAPTFTAGTREAVIDIGSGGYPLPTGVGAWWTASTVHDATFEATEPSLALSAAVASGVLPVAAARLTLVGSTYYGVDVEGNTSSPTQLRRLVAQNEAGVIQQSPYIGSTLIDAVFTATDAYTAAYFLTATTPSLYSTTEVRRFSLSDITTTAATYTASVAGDIKGIAHDGTDLWVLEADTPRLRRLDGSALTVSETQSLAGVIGNGLAFADGLLFYVEDDDIVARDPTGSPTIVWRTALPAGYYATKDILVADGNVFVSTWFGVVVYDAATGALVTETGLIAYPCGGSMPTLVPFGDDAAIYLGPTAAQKYVVLDGATGAQVTSFDATPDGLLGADATRLWLAAQSVPTIVGADEARGYEPLGGSFSGYRVTVYQMSAVVGRGYGAELTIP